VLLLWIILALGWLAIALLAFALFRVASYANKKVRGGEVRRPVERISIEAQRPEGEQTPAA
jgi:hypothetical protein